jgi:hypothetical protein
MIGFSGLAVAQVEGVPVAEEGLPVPGEGVGVPEGGVPIPERVVIDLLVGPDFVDIICPASNCTANCPELENVLFQNQCYRIGPDCAVESNCSALFDALENTFSLLGSPIVPGGGGQPPPGLNPNFLVPTEANQNLVVPDASITVPIPIP